MAVNGDDVVAGFARRGVRGGFPPRPAPPFGYRVEHCLGDGVAVVARTGTYVAALRCAAMHARDRRVARLGGRLRVVEEAFGTVIAARRLTGEAG